jgi:hypothetical protein
MNALVTIEEAKKLIAQGRPLLFAGDEQLLAQLPKGRWIGGTIPYFMAAQGGVKTAAQVFVTQLPPFIAEAEARLYEVDQMATIPEHAPANGASFIIVPGLSTAHTEFAQKCATWKGVFDHPLLGWISGVDLADLGKVAPRVFDGQTGQSSSNAAVVMHVKVPEGYTPRLDILNLFAQGQGDVLTFTTEGFAVTDVLVNGEQRNFAEYLAQKAIDTRLPLVADYNGAMVNISFQAVDAVKKTVALYAPVFEGVSYRIAEPLSEDYTAAFQKELASRSVAPVFACNCILNYLYGGLEGKKTGAITGPITFGEIAYMLLNPDHGVPGLRARTALKRRSARRVGEVEAGERLARLHVDRDQLVVEREVEHAVRRREPRAKVPGE